MKRDELIQAVKDLCKSYDEAIAFRDHRIADLEAMLDDQIREEIVRGENRG